MSKYISFLTGTLFLGLGLAVLGLQIKDVVAFTLVANFMYGMISLMNLDESGTCGY